MASVWQHKRGGWYLQIVLPTQRRVKIYLGKITAKHAHNLARKIDELANLVRLGEPPTPDLAAWLVALDAGIVERLGECGLTRTWAKPKTAPRLVDWWQQYVDGRTDFAASTIKGWKTAYLHVEARFPTQTLDEITALDAKTWARDLGQAVAPTHAAKILGRVSQVYAAAIDARVITENPFHGIKTSREIDQTRKLYVANQTSLMVLDKFATLEGRALFAMARWCGLRVPHEPLALTWRNVDWELARIQIPADTKTGGRIVPMFPEVETELVALFAAAGTGSVHVFTRARSSAATEWRRWLLSAIAAAHLEPWPHLWHNLRASCRTDLEERFPTHVCDAWLGHSARVAKDHYLRVTPEHWATATQTHARTAQPPAHGPAHGTEGVV